MFPHSSAQLKWLCSYYAVFCLDNQLEQQNSDSQWSFPTWWTSAVCRGPPVSSQWSSSSYALTFYSDVRWQTNDTPSIFHAILDFLKWWYLETSSSSIPNVTTNLSLLIHASSLSLFNPYGCRFLSFSFSSKTLDPLHPSHHCSIPLVGEWEIPLDSISIGLLKKIFFSLQLWTREVPLDPPNVPLKPLTHMLFCCLVTVPAPLTFAFNQKKCLLSSNAHWPFIPLKTHSLPSPSFQLFPSLTTFLRPCQLYAHATLGRTQCLQTVIADMLVHHMLPVYDLATKTLSAMA